MSIDIQALALRAAERISAQKQQKEDREQMKTEATRWGVVCSGGDYNTDDKEDLIPIAKGWTYEQDLAALQGRIEPDNLKTALFYADCRIESKREFVGDDDRSEHRLYATTLMMLKEFVKVKLVKGEFVPRFADEEAEQQAVNDVCYQDCRDLKNNPGKLARFRQYFGNVTKLDFDKAREATYGETYYELIKAVLKVDGTSAFARYAKKQYAKKVTAKEVADGRVSVEDAAKHNHRIERAAEIKRTRIIHTLEQMGRDAAKKTKEMRLQMIKEAHARVKERQLAIA